MASDIRFNDGLGSVGFGKGSTLIIHRPRDGEDWFRALCVAFFQSGQLDKRRVFTVATSEQKGATDKNSAIVRVAFSLCPNVKDNFTAELKDSKDELDVLFDHVGATEDTAKTSVACIGPDLAIRLGVYSSSQRQKEKIASYIKKGGIAWILMGDSTTPYKDISELMDVIVVHPLRPMCSPIDPNNFARVRYCLLHAKHGDDRAPHEAVRRFFDENALSYAYKCKDAGAESYAFACNIADRKAAFFRSLFPTKVGLCAIDKKVMPFPGTFRYRPGTVERLEREASACLPVKKRRLDEDTEGEEGPFSAPPRKDSSSDEEDEELDG